jgi:hypothetical protein
MKNLPLTLKYACYFLAGSLVMWGIDYYFPDLFPIPIIAGTQVKTFGLTFFFMELTVLIFYIKALLKANPEYSVLLLSAYGCLVCVFAEPVFQIIRVLNMDLSLAERMHKFIFGVLGGIALAFVISFLIAYQIKTKRTGITILIFVTIGAIIRVIQFFFQSPA